MTTSNIALQAEYFSNISILDRNYSASVHLEADEDGRFWDTVLQEFRPGKYYYIYHSRSEKDKETSGSAQCLKYADFLSERFFVCIDSDMRYLKNEREIIANPYILQTYTFSWENHYCFAEHLQAVWQEKCPELSGSFDFRVFLESFSKAAYPKFMDYLVKMKGGLSRQRLTELFPTTYSDSDFKDNGKLFLEKLSVGNGAIQIDKHERNFFESLGLNEDNTYLHVRGHYIYDLIKYVGTRICSKTSVNFERDILLSGLQTYGYWEMDKIGEKVKGI